GALGVEMAELNDWNCCGGGAVSSVEPDLALAFSARNLSLAEETGNDIAVSCAACYTNLRRARAVVTGKTAAAKRLRESLADINRKVTGASQVKHLLEIIVNDIGLNAINAAVQKPLTGLKVAAYYGCQMGRPAGSFVHPEMPHELDDLVAALGAEPVAWKGKVRCCGATTMVTKEEAAAGLVDRLLSDAEAAGAQLIATACPLCHMNLDAYQATVNRHRGKAHRMPVVYFTQLMELAMGRQPDLSLAFVPAEPVIRGVVR
ncbi:MAG TPA: CoB--CoM heterodisulfide reductase iron-sulfur subunit B family protein, partial [Symbiobacteriaceae bacterium]|nr:CoB--CoM heterodisulfide reductase iron-sulfur subunit B family protein [Symbiobacteriaceae bacterium]